MKTKKTGIIVSVIIFILLTIGGVFWAISQKHIEIGNQKDPDQVVLNTKQIVYSKKLVNLLDKQKEDLFDGNQLPSKFSIKIDRSLPDYVQELAILSQKTYGNQDAETVTIQNTLIYVNKQIQTNRELLGIVKKLPDAKDKELYTYSKGMQDWLTTMKNNLMNYQQGNVDINDSFDATLNKKQNDTIIRDKDLKNLYQTNRYIKYQYTHYRINK